MFFPPQPWKRVWRALPAWRALGLVGLGLGLLAGCEGPPRAAGSVEAPPDLELTGVGLKVYRGGELRAVGRADSASLRQGSGAVVAEQTRLELLGSQPDERIARLDARHATGNVNDRSADATGGVEMRDAEGTVGTTARAHFDGAAELASGTDPVLVEGRDGRFRVNAEGGFRMALGDGGRLVLQGPTRTELKGDGL